jgi:hypothetical protein
MDEVRFELKQRWYETLARWDRADLLLKGERPLTKAEARLKKNYERFRQTTQEFKTARPSAAQLYRGLSVDQFYAASFSTNEMLEGFYPNAFDIRCAFHYCLAVTGWNPATLLRIQVDKEYLRINIKDKNRYVMYGHKGRGDSEHINHGLINSKASAGNVVQTLVSRTEPLRSQLRTELKLQLKRQRSMSGRASRMQTDAIRQKIAQLRAKIRSPWLYTPAGTDTICNLTKKTYTRGESRTGGRLRSFLREFITRLNKNKPKGSKLILFDASDFRDDYAHANHELSGGNVRYVMRVLRHRRAGTTGGYLDNSRLNDESDRLYRAFSSSLWAEIKSHKRVDTTILAKWSRDGFVSSADRARLTEYRTMRRSRINTGCKDPTNPPRHIAPRFVRDGQSMCQVQRCVLCPENVVIFPDSLSGLCMRQAELLHHKSTMSATAFLESSFPAELDRLEWVLHFFDTAQVSYHRTDWLKRIADGHHRVVEFEGLPKSHF